MNDPYQTLGVSRDASQDDIHRAYIKLAKQHHPDLNPGDTEAEAQFKIVSAANELLSDPGTRGQFDRGEINADGQERRPPRPSYRDYAESEHGRRYDRESSKPGEPRHNKWTAEAIHEIFGTMFNHGDRSSDDSPLRGQDERYILAADFLDAVNGATRRLTLPDGRTLDVKIPPGTVNGQVLRLQRQGRPSPNGGTDGDALIEIQVAAHKHFTRHGQDIRLVLPVTLSEAVLGGSIEVPTPGGPVRMRVPAGSDSGTELRLRGRGVSAYRGRAAGDLYATLRVVLGAPDAALEAFLSTWKPEHPAYPRQGMEASL